MAIVAIFVVHCSETCRAGEYFVRELGRCVACARGSYQPQTGQDYCVQCPAGTTTDHQSAVSAAHCKSKTFISYFFACCIL